MQTTPATIKCKEKEIYKRNWSLYNIAQTSEKLLALRILNDAVNHLNIPYDYKGNGRPPIGIDDMIKCCVVKVFNGFSSRRSIPDLEMCKALGYIREVPHFNSLNNYMRSEEITGYLHKLYEILAMPFRGVENNFAIDATGFGTFKRNWAEKKGWFQAAPKPIKRKMFKKLHIVCGVRTNIITSAEVKCGIDHESPLFPNLMRETAKRFDVKHIYADAGYLSKENCEVAEEIGAVPFIKPKKNMVMKAVIEYKKKRTAWREMMIFFHDRQKTFEMYYHRRSNVESSFSMIKRKFLPYVRSKDTTAQFNEMLCKVVCHNLGVLVNAIFELDLAADFRRIPAASDSFCSDD